MALWFVNPLLKEMGMYALNPKRHRSRHRARRRRNPSPFFLMGNARHKRHRGHHRRHRYAHNPMGSGPLGAIMGVVKHPMDYVINGAMGTLGAVIVIGVPNQFLGGTTGALATYYNDAGYTGKIVRGLSRVAAGGLAYWAARKFMPRSAGSVAAGATIAAGGAFILDLLGTSLTIGRGDAGQTISGFFSSISAPGFTGYGAYIPGRRMGAYSRPMLPAAAGFAGVYAGMGPGLTRHGLYGA